MFALRQQFGELGILELELDVLVEIILDFGADALPELADRSLFIRARFLSRSWDRFPWLAPAPKQNGGDGRTLQRRVRQFCDRP